MPNPTKILVTGASGQVGSAVVVNLIAMGAEVKALVHDESKVRLFSDVGIEAIAADFEKAETLDAPLSGVDSVFLITPAAPKAVAQAFNVISAAQQAGKLQIVRLSSYEVAFDHPTILGRQHSEIEGMLKDSGLPYTILRPAFFMQNTMMAARTVTLGCPYCQCGILSMPLKDSYLNMIDVRDVGEAAARVLSSCGHEGKIYTLTGPTPISCQEAAERLSIALRKEVKYLNIPLSVSREVMLGMGVPAWAADARNEFFKAHWNGCGDFTTDDVKVLTGHQARSYEEFAKDFASVFGGDAN